MKHYNTIRSEVTTAKVIDALTGHKRDYKYLSTLLYGEDYFKSKVQLTLYKIKAKGINIIYDKKAKLYTIEVNNES